MTDTQPVLTPGHASEGKPAAMIAWALYILSIPSANVLVLVGLVIAYVSRGSATGLARQHIDAQIVLFAVVVWIVVRGAAGVFRLKAGQPIPRPLSWWI